MIFFVWKFAETAKEMYLYRVNLSDLANPSDLASLGSSHTLKPSEKKLCFMGLFKIYVYSKSIKNSQIHVVLQLTNVCLCSDLASLKIYL